MPTNDTLKDLLKFDLLRIVGSNFSLDHHVTAFGTYSQVFWF
ncbi:MAG: hypothetical protein ACFFA3_05865 [Promethearchaeota archaeon]